MKTKNRRPIGIKSYLAVLFSVHVVFVILQLTKVFNIDIQHMLVVQFISLLITFLSAAVLFVNNNNRDASAQIIRLIVLIVLQLIGYMSSCAALILTYKPRTLVMYLLSMALSVLVFQTSYLVRRLK